MNERKADYFELCEDVRKCTICQSIKFTPHIENSDFLMQDKKPYDEVYVNRWNLLQNSLNAEIMVVGQDYGSCEENYFVTDETLKKLFLDVFSIDIDKKNPHLFFTNIANCYRQRKSTGNINKGCLSLCANKFMTRLISIVSPKVIVVLGQDTFNALACCDKAKLICKNPTKKKVNNNFSTVMEFDYSLVFEDGKEIAVFPVYHPGANGRMNRPYERQLDDWKRILEFMKERELFMNDKHLVHHRNMYGASCEVASGNNEDDFKIYCHKEHKICVPKKCDKCEYFGGSEMNYGICCDWEESYEDISGDEHTVQHDEVYMEFQRVENPDIYKKMLKMVEDGELDLCKAWQGLD